MKYNLTFWQKIELIPIFVMWIITDTEKRVSWHIVKKRMEKHEHKYTKPFIENGVEFLQCEYEGCNFCEPVDEIN